MLSKDHVDYLDRFVEHVRSQPNAVAIDFGTKRLTYIQLSHRVAEIQRLLSKHSVSAGTPVGVLMERTPDMLATLLAVHSLGAYFIPLDIKYPQSRLDHFVETSNPSIIVVDDRTSSRAVVFGRPVLVVHRAHGSPTPLKLNVPVSEGLLSYVLFTSGSTGLPKGVEIRRRSMSDLLESMSERIGFEEGHSMLCHTTVAFDMSIPELFLAFSRGGRVVLADAEVASNPPELASLLSTVDFAQATPTMWRILLDSSVQTWPELTAICGAENLSTALAARLLERVKRLWNFYGPTETTVWVTSALIDATTSQIPLGQALNGVRLTVIPTEIDMADEFRCDASGETIGELVVLGDFVASGYHRDPETTNRSFGYDNERDTRYYRTGDIVRQTSGGEFYWLGRGDGQVKVRGNRIDVGEVVRRLEHHPGISMAHVTTIARDDTNDVVLIAYVKITGQLVRRELDLWISEQLPSYMVPSHYVPIASLPMLPNGKLDSRSLPKPSRSNTLRNKPSIPEAHQSVPASISRTETVVLQVVQRLLKDDEITLSDSFVDVGGSSATALIGSSMMTKELGRRVLPEWLLEPVSIRDAVTRIEGHGSRGAVQTSSATATSISGETQLG